MNLQLKIMIPGKKFHEHFLIIRKEITIIGNTAQYLRWDSF